MRVPIPGVTVFVGSHLADDLVSSTATVEIRVDPDRLRASDVDVLIGDGTRCRQVCGWEPPNPFEVTLRDVRQYWRPRL